MSYSVGNSTISPLVDGDSFTGNWEDVNGYLSINLSLETDQNGTFQIDFSDQPSLGSIHTSYHFLNVTGGVKELRSFHVAGKYFRIVMTNNSGSNQTTLKLYCHLKSSDSMKHQLGYLNNLVNDATLGAGLTSNTLDVLLINKGYIFYEDSVIASTDGFEIEVSLDNTNWHTLNSGGPSVVGAKRVALVDLSLEGIRYLRIKNVSTTDDYLNVKASVVGIN